MISGQIAESNSNLALSKSLTLSGTVEMDPSDFDALLKEIRIESMAAEEPRLSKILADVNFGNLCCFLLHYYEGGRRCRYFVREQKTVYFLNNFYKFFGFFSILL